MTRDPSTTEQLREELEARTDLPAHVAIIMDGNGRWAASRNLSRLEGHKAGWLSVRGAAQACLDLGVRYLTLFAFGVENWKRSESEVSGLMLLLRERLRRNTREMLEKGIRFRPMGRLEDLPRATLRAVKRAEERTAAMDRLILTMAISYSGKTEILSAAQQIARDAALSDINHAMYLGRQLAKAELALKEGREFVQD